MTTPMTRIKCPVDWCSWVYDATEPNVPADALASVFGARVMTAVSQRQHMHRTETEVRLHLESHKVDEFVLTITRLQNACAEMLAAVQELTR